MYTTIPVETRCNSLLENNIKDPTIIDFNGPGELRIRRIRIRITAALMPVDARITSWGIMGSWPRQPSPKGSGLR